MNNKTNETIFRENYGDSLKTVRIEAPEDVRLVPVVVVVAMYPL